MGVCAARLSTSARARASPAWPAEDPWNTTVCTSLAVPCGWAGLEAVCELYGLFDQFLPQHPLNRVDYRRTKVCLRPDFLFQLPLASGQVQRRIADVKTISFGVPSYYKPGAGGKRGAAGWGGGGGGNGSGGTGVTDSETHYGGPGGSYGGGAGGANHNSGRAGATGAVRIIWGSGRAFPNTNTIDQ